MELKLESKDCEDRTVRIANIMATPPIGGDYWLFRVKVSDKQAVVAFPKFTTIGIGFAVEHDDWNCNLPWTCAPEKIMQHIECNKEDADHADCLHAIEMLQAACREYIERNIQAKQ